MFIPSGGCGCCCEVAAGRQATSSESHCDQESRPARPLCLEVKKEREVEFHLLSSSDQKMDISFTSICPVQRATLNLAVQARLNTGLSLSENC